MDINTIIRPHLLGIKPYSSARDEYTGKEGVFLDANENPYGSGVEKAFNRYPDPYQASLKQKIAKIKHVQTDQIFLGNGSDEPIDLLMRAFCEPGVENIIINPPTYGMYSVSAAVNNILVKEARLNKQFQLEPEVVFRQIDNNTKLIFICSPNNPTGNSMEQEQIVEILQQFNGLVIVDEAYIDFAERKSCLELIDRMKNLVVLQTFSKAWGLAALRLGMAFADPQIIQVLNHIKPPYNVNGATQHYALQALDNMAWKDEKVASILKDRKRMEQELLELKDVENVYPSDANFLLVQFKDAQRVFDYLIDRRIIVRNRSNVMLCEGCLRITVGTSEENDLLLETLKKYQP